MRRSYPSLALGFAVAMLAGCDSTTAPDAHASPPAEVGTPSNPASASALSNSAPVEVHRAEFTNGFCFFVVFDAGGVSGYSGGSTAVTTPSGQKAYRCIGDLLFGPGITTTLNLRHVSFSNDFFQPELEPCHVMATPGPKGRANVTCHVRDVRDQQHPQSR